MKKYIIIQGNPKYKTYNTLEQAKEFISGGNQFIIEVKNEWSVDIKKVLIGTTGGGK